MKTNVTFAGTAAVALLAVAGCGFGQQSRPPSPRPTPDVVAIYHDFADCVRHHGFPDFPDPTIDADGKPQVPAEYQNIEPPEALRQACGPILDRLPAQSSGGRQAVTVDPAMMRRFAQCMRENGITDWPDPDAQGHWDFPPSLANFKSSPRVQQIDAAWHGPCLRYTVDGRIG